MAIRSPEVGARDRAQPIYQRCARGNGTNCRQITKD
jgi:hypothetical protein